MTCLTRWTRLGISEQFATIIISAGNHCGAHSRRARCGTRRKRIHAILAQTVLQGQGISLALFSQNIFIYRHRIGLIKIICENISLNTIVESHIQYLQIIQLTLFNFTIL